MTSAPWGTPKALGLSTITWIARTRIPLLVVPEHGRAPPPSQVCSLRVTEPIPGNRIVVLGGGLSLTDMPPTESPSRLVPCALDEDLPPLETLLACEMIALANTVHEPFTGSTQTFCALAKLDELLLEVRTVPALSLTEVPPLTNEVVSWSRSWWSCPPCGGMLTKPTTTGSADGLVCSLTIAAFPLTVPTSEGHPADCGKSACAWACETTTSTASPVSARLVM